MAVFVIDAAAAIELVRGDYKPASDELFAPTLLRSQVLSQCLEAVRQDGSSAAEALELAERACRLPRRLLGDAVLRRNAWKLATDNGWPDTFDAEYIALTQLHGDALIVGKAELRNRAIGLVPTMSVADLLVD